MEGGDTRLTWQWPERGKQCKKGEREREKRKNTVCNEILSKHNNIHEGTQSCLSITGPSAFQTTPLRPCQQAWAPGRGVSAAAMGQSSARLVGDSPPLPR